MIEPTCGKKEHFDREGYLFRPAFRSKEQIDGINEHLKRVIETVVPNLPAEHVFYEDKSDALSLKQIQRLHECDAFFGDLMTNGPFRNLAESLIGTEVTCQNMQYFNKPPGTGLPTPAHQDGYYFKIEPVEAVTIWMALEEVDEENGCVRYVPRSHKPGMRPHGKTGTLGFSQGIIDFPNEDDLKSEIAFPAQPGDLLAHHALTIHRAEGNNSKSRTRRALGFIYYSVNVKQDVTAWSRYQSELKRDLESTGKI